MFACLRFDRPMRRPRGPIAAPLSRLVRRNHDLGAPVPRNGYRCRTRWGQASGRSRAHLRKHKGRFRPAQAHSRACRHQQVSPRRRPWCRRDRQSETPAFARQRVRATACDGTERGPRFHTARGLSAEIGKDPRFAKLEQLARWRPTTQIARGQRDRLLTHDGSGYDTSTARWTATVSSWSSSIAICKRRTASKPLAQCAKGSRAGPVLAAPKGSNWGCSRSDGEGPRCCRRGRETSPGGRHRCRSGLSRTGLLVLLAACGLRERR